MAEVPRAEVSAGTRQAGRRQEEHPDSFTECEILIPLALGSFRFSADAIGLRTPRHVAERS